MRIAAITSLVALACSSSPPAARPPSACDGASQALADAKRQQSAGYLLRAREAAAALGRMCSAAGAEQVVAAIDGELALPPAATPSAEAHRKAALLYRDAVRLRLQGNHIEAIRRLERSLALSPHPFILLQIAEAHAALDHTVDARRSIARALHLAETRAGARVTPLLASGHGGAISSVALSADGRTLYSGASDGMVIAWDMSSGRERWRTPLRRLFKVFGLTVSPDGGRAAAVCDERVHLLDASTGALTGRLPVAKRRASRTLYLDDERLAVGMMDGTIEVWRGDALLTTLAAPENTSGTSLSLAADRSHWAAGWSNGHVALYDAADLRQLWTRPTERPVRDVAVAADAARVYAALWGGEVAIFDRAGTGASGFAGDPDGVYALSLFDGDRKLAVGAHSRMVRVFDLASGEVVHEVSQPSSVQAIAALASGEVAAIGDGSGELGAVNLMTGKLVRPMTRGGTEPFGALFHPAGDQLALRLDNGSTVLWNLSTGAPIHLRADDHQAWRAAYSGDGARLATVSQQGEVIVWRTRDGAQLARFGDRDLELLSVAWSADGGQLYTGDEGGNVAIWDPDRGTRLDRFKVHEHWVLTLEVSPDQRLLASGSLDSKAAIIDIASRKVLHRLPHYREVHGARFTADGTRLVTAGFDGYVRVFDVASGKLLHETARPETSFKDLAVAGGIAYAAGADRRVHAVRIADGKELDSYGVHDALLLSVAVHPTAPLIASGSFDRTTRLWHRDTHDLLAAITVSDDGQWVVVTPDARVDTSAADGRTHLLSWRAGDVQLPSWVGWQRGATPGLLAAVVKAL